MRYTDAILWNPTLADDSLWDDVSVTSKIDAGYLGYKLWEDCANDLLEIQSVLSTSDLKYQLLVDKLAEELLLMNEDMHKVCQNC